MWGNGGGQWRCSVKERARNARRIRMQAGGIEFFVGRAPTTTAAQTLRTRMREEAPHGAVRNP